MLSRVVATVASVDDAKLESLGVQIVRTERGEAVNYREFSGIVNPGDQVLLNNTARDLGLGTGGYDFVIARLSADQATLPAERTEGHVMRLRYTPLQHSVAVCEETDQFGTVSNRLLDGFPAVACELHSQIAPVAAAIELRFGLCAYIMTDSACLGFGLSDLAASLINSDLLQSAFAVGQAYGDEHVLHAVTVHNALLAAKYCVRMDTAIICQGPGNTGTNTKYGFSGIAQAAHLDTIAVLGGTPIACVRASSGDKRDRHTGISHHTSTVLELVRSRCIVAVPDGLETPAKWSDRHDVRIVPCDKTQAALDRLVALGIDVTTMGRTVDDDPLFFHTAAAAGVVAAEMAKGTQS
jgi:hypothetical protein